MSEEAAHALVERVNTDEDFRNALMAADGAETRLRMAQDAGFDITADDLADMRRQAGFDELSEDDLQRIAGGQLTNTQVTIASGVMIVAGTVGFAAMAV